MKPSSICLVSVLFVSNNDVLQKATNRRIASVAEWSGVLDTILGVLGAGSKPTKDIYFHLECVGPFPFLTAKQISWNEIKHDHLHEVFVFLDPRYDKSYKAYAYILP